MELEKIRKSLDDIDKNIVSLYEERLELIKKVAIYKLKHNKEVLDTDREIEKIEQVIQLLSNPNNGKSIENLYIEIMKESRKIQSKMIESNRK